MQKISKIGRHLWKLWISSDTFLLLTM